MNLWTMIVAVVFMGLVGAVAILHQVKSMRSQSTPSDSELKMKVQLAELEQRVRTLERIATDSKSQLRDTIDSL